MLTPTLSAPARSSAVDVVDGAHAAADGERDEDLLGRAPHHVVGRRAVAAARGDVEEDQLVGALGVVGAGQLDRVAGVAQVDEVDALDHAAGVDVEARDHADGDGHGVQPRQRGARRRRPVAAAGSTRQVRALPRLAWAS